MLQFDKRLYDFACDLKRGTAQLSPSLESVRAKLANHFNITIVAIIFDAINIGPAKGKPRLNIITEFKATPLLLKKDRTLSSEARHIILDTFIHEMKNAEPQQPVNPEKILVITENFSAAAINQAIGPFKKYEPVLLQKFADDNVWRIVEGFNGVVVFFTDENAKRTASQNGTFDRIRKACFDQIKPYDEFNYLTLESLNIKFDTKENLDKNFAGNLFYYFR